MFLLSLGVVAVRQPAALRTVRSLDDIRNDHAALDARRADLERQIRRARSREVLMPKVMQRHGLRIAADDEIVFLRTPIDTAGR